MTTDELAKVAYQAWSTPSLRFSDAAWKATSDAFRQDWARAAEAVAAAVLPAGSVAVDAVYLAALELACREAMHHGYREGCSCHTCVALAALRQRQEWAGKEGGE